ncbi:MAG: magnesium transporter [Gemmataceae bacterium]|nr:magnesium transporter [Gemmataceae bacterium]
MAHDLFGPEVKVMVLKDDGPGMAAFCEVLHPATVAEALEGEFGPTIIWDFLRHASPENQSAIFSYLATDTQNSLIGVAPPEQMAHVIETMSHDDRADLLRRMEPGVRDPLIRHMAEAERRDIAALSQFDENTAGALMTTDYAWLPENLSVDEAFERLRLQAPDKETIYYIYIVDDQRRIVGVVSLKNLVLANRQATLADIMETRVVALNVREDRENVAQELARYDLLAIPVVDDDRRLVGIITHDDVMDVVVSEATEDAHRMGAVAPLEGDYLDTPFSVIWRKRSMWLACLFIAELFTFTALSSYADSISKVIILSLFVPLCISTGGNSGSQAATLITRAMALGQVRLSDWRRVLGHEVVMGILLGLTLGIIGFGRAWFTPEDIRSSSPPRHEAFRLILPQGTSPLVLEENGHILLPRYAKQEILPGETEKLRLPDKAVMPSPVIENNSLVYLFPPGCFFPREPVDRLSIALVVSGSVAMICLWGTIIGAMLPLFFRRIGVDPAVASSPFVATAVDVTGIVIYFTMARLILGPLLG